MSNENFLNSINNLLEKERKNTYHIKRSRLLENSLNIEVFLFPEGKDFSISNFLFFELLITISVDKRIEIKYNNRRIDLNQITKNKLTQHLTDFKIDDFFFILSDFISSNKYQDIFRI